jgi:hypothetical protein
MTDSGHSSRLNGGIPILGKVLVLMIGFTLPLRDNQYTKNILDAITGLCTSTIANKFIHISPFADVIFKSVNKLLISFHTVDICNQRGPSDENLGSFNTTINRRGIAEDSISGNRFIPMSNIACRKGDFQCCCRVSDTLPRLYWVVTTRVFWIVSAGAQAKKGGEDCNHGVNCVNQCCLPGRCLQRAMG